MNQSAGKEGGRQHHLTTLFVPNVFALFVSLVSTSSVRLFSPHDVNKFFVSFYILAKWCGRRSQRFSFIRHRTAFPLLFVN